MRLGAMLSDVARGLLRRPVTRRYPFERAPVPARLRGALRWLPARCTGCGMCARDCPAGAIELIAIDKTKKRFVLRYHVDRCTFCAQCVRTCNFDCLELAGQRWELAAPRRDALTICYGDDADLAAIPP